MDERRKAFGKAGEPSSAAVDHPQARDGWEEIVKPKRE
jgi:hypothetical protein